MNPGLRVATAFLGVALCGLSVGLNFQLYTSLVGSSNVEKFSYQYIGIALDFSKVVCLLLAMYLWFSISSGRAVLLGVVCFIFYVILSCISLSAGWGFGLKSTANGENERLQGSMAMQSLQSQVSNAESKASEYAQFAHIDKAAIVSKLSTLKAELKGLQGDLRQCPRNFLTHCIRPTRAKIDAKQVEITPLQNQLNGYTQYTGAVTHKTALFNDMGSLDSSSMASVIHPLFVATGDLFNVSPREAKQGLLLISFIVLEMLGSLFFAVGLMFGNGTSYAPVMAQSNPMGFTPQPANARANSANKPSFGFIDTNNQPVDLTGLNRKNGNDAEDTILSKSTISAMDTDKPILSKSTISPQRKRTRGTPDSNTSGAASKRYAHVKSLVKNGTLNPTIYALTKVDFGGVKISRPVAIEYQKAMLAEGVIQNSKSRNGKPSFVVSV